MFVNLLYVELWTSMLPDMFPAVYPGSDQSSHVQISVRKPYLQLAPLSHILSCLVAIT
jgi:hypothetical protein